MNDAAVSLLCCSVHISDFPVVQDWIQEGDVSIYDAENLWEYIDGGADRAEMLRGLKDITGD